MPKADTSPPLPGAAAPAAEQESFVINLCSSTTPMALTQPQLAELKRYAFFVSRRLEDGRERFRLHMGYFDSLQQAEELLPLVRDIYPGAWAGEAPGKRLRAKSAAARPAPAAPAPPVAVPVPAASERAAPTLAAAPNPTVAPNPPTLAAAPPAIPAPPKPAPVRVPDLQPKPVARTGPVRRDVAVPLERRSNVREVMKSLDESAPRSQAPERPAAAPVREPGVLPESAVLRLLEEKRGDPLNTTSTPAAFAVQLQWSVQSIDLARVPPLAIFAAYTLYTVEGSREGRRWYGLRLGFFSDANAAKQVAQYVRSEFASVAVVPVSLKERDGASGAVGGAAAVNRTTERLPDQSAEFKLLDDTGDAPKPPAAAASPAAADPSRAKPAVGAKSPRRRGLRVDAH
ncbi:MAG TPA: hypothetical protein VMC02_06950, partial [Steroidobacteraceae bacterium]|nr:hypothetical protein [Steroidobacteraceae bacterium]